MEQAIQEKQNEAQDGQEKNNKNLYFTHSDIYDTIKRMGKELPIEKFYDPEIFWDSIGEEYFKTFKKKEQLIINTQWLCDRLRVIKVKDILEVGCGFARILPILLDAGVIEETYGIDISIKVLESSKKYLEPPELKEDEKAPPDFRDRINLKLGDVRKLQIESGTYDLVLSCECLQHISPADIPDALMEMIRVSKKYIICIERWAFPGEHSEPHLWSHNIAAQLMDLGVEVLQVTTVANGMQGIVARKRG